MSEHPLPDNNKPDSKGRIRRKRKRSPRGIEAVEENVTQPVSSRPSLEVGIESRESSARAYKPSHSGVRRKRKRLDSGGQEALAQDLNTRIYRWLEIITESLIYLMVVFTIWAFGSVYTYSADWFGRPDWASWWMSLAGITLFLLWIGKYALRTWGGVQVATWDQLLNRNMERRIHNIWKWGLAGAGSLVVVYTWIAAWNARADYIPSAWRFDYFENYISWLPHSYDVEWSWRAFWENLGLFCSFWAIRDWLNGRTAQEVKDWEKRRRLYTDRGAKPIPFISDRMRRLLWVVCVNAGLVGVQGILQRLSGTGKVLWIIEPFRNKTALSQFGPYPYRSNGAQFFNMIWPLCLGFWWSMKLSEDAYKRYGKHDHKNYHPILLPLLLVLMVCPVVTASRGGSILMAVGMVFAIIILFKSSSQIHWKSTLWVGGIMALVMMGVSWLGWDDLSKRLENQGLESEGRMIARENAKEMLSEYFWLGSGPKTYGSLVDYYVGTPSESHGFFNLHDDWMEAFITYGIFGGGLILVGLFFVLSYWFIGAGGAPAHWSLPCLILIGMGTCLAHARFDFPFQVYSLNFYFVLLAAMYTSLSRRRA